MSDLNRVTEIKAPGAIPFGTDSPTVFLAGSIEMGTAENWQDRTVHFFRTGHYGIKPTATAPYYFPEGVTLLNPRRDDWDSSWEQKMENDQFREQVKWELEAMEYADVILMYFSPNTKSPITLMELGLHAKHEDNGPPKVVVACPEGFWRRGNVEIVCKKYGIGFHDSLPDALTHVHEMLTWMHH